MGFGASLEFGVPSRVVPGGVDPTQSGEGFGPDFPDSPFFGGDPLFLGGRSEGVGTLGGIGPLEGAGL